MLYFTSQNGHTVPAIETLEKMARALHVTPTSFYEAKSRPDLNL